MREIFVLMPFDESFDDVFHIIKDSGRQSADDTKVDIKVYRADDISDPGRISIQVLAAIESADLIIADLTGSNPNVMYELGYAHASKKEVVILNQSVQDSPFDVKDFRQITYDRTKVVRDCRPRLVTAINSTIGKSGNSLTSANQPVEIERITETSIVRRPGTALVADVQAIHIKLQMARKVLHDKHETRNLGVKLRDLIDTVTIMGRVDEEQAKNTAGSIGNCAVELEQSEEYELAREIFTRAISLFPDHGGLRLQYSDFLFDQGDEDDARIELDRARAISPEDKRIHALERKFATRSMTKKGTDAGMLRTLRTEFEENPQDRQAAVAYLMALDNTEETPVDEFEHACEVWAEALGAEDGAVARRALADFLAKNDPPRAIEIYEELLNPSTGIASGYRHDILHNVATLLSETDRERATRYWTEAYNMDKTNAVIVASFSQRLASWGKLDSAMKVVNGEPLEMPHEDA